MAGTDKARTVEEQGSDSGCCPDPRVEPVNRAQEELSRARPIFPAQMILVTNTWCH